MPRNSMEIYVPPTDRPVIDRAKHYLINDHDNLSISSIALAAIKQYVEQQENKLLHWQQYSIEIGRYPKKGEDLITTKSFTGRLLVQGTHDHGQTRDKKDRGTHWTFYLTKQGKILVHWESWSTWPEEADLADYLVLNNLDELFNLDPQDIPEEIRKEAMVKLAEIQAERDALPEMLDI